MGTTEVVQQREWAHCVVDEAVDLRVPGEVVKQFMGDVEGMMDMPEAEEYARDLRDMRERFREANDLCHSCLLFDIWSPLDKFTKY